MIISEKLLKELKSLNEEIENVLRGSSLTDLQIESFFRNFEKRRYNILSEIKLHNKHVEFEYEKIKTIDNKYVKPIADALISSGVIQDDNISKMFYATKGEFSETPHTEIYVLDGQKIANYLEKSTTKKYGFFENF